MLKKPTSLFIITALTLLLFTSCDHIFPDKNNDNEPDNPPSTDIVINENAVWGKGINLRVIIKDGTEDSMTDFINHVSSVTGTSAVLATDIIAPVEHEFIIGETERSLSKTAYELLYKTIDHTQEDGWLIYTEGTSVATAYTSEKAYSDMWKFIENEFYSKAELVFEEKGVVSSGKYNLKDIADAQREAARKEAFDLIEKNLGSNTRAAIERLYTLYTPEAYEWMAELYDPAVGGFYFANTGRDNYGFLPDIESTYQVLTHLNAGGMFSDKGGYASALPSEMKAAILNFTKSLQSSEDGYFYHPQWGYKNEIIPSNYKDARRGRDLTWATRIIASLGGIPLWNTPSGETGEFGAPGTSKTALTSRLSHSYVNAVSNVLKSSTLLPAHLQSIDAWKAYINSLRVTSDPYGAGNTLAAQHSVIQAAGKEYIDYLTSYLTSVQNTETGFWGNGVSYTTMNGFMKLSHSYSYYGKSIPNVDKALDSTITVLLKADTDREDLTICYTFNTWANFRQILDSAMRDGEYKTLQQKIIDQAPALINITYDKIVTHKRSEGGFSYFENQPCNLSQKAPVACATSPESDVNATHIAIAEITSCLFSSLGIVRVPLYVPADGDVFLRMLEYAEPLNKTNPTEKEPDLSGTRGNGIYYQNSEQYTETEAPLVTSASNAKIYGENDKYLYFYKDVNSFETNAHNSITYVIDDAPSDPTGIVFELDIAFIGFSNYTNSSKQVAGLQINFYNGKRLASIYFDGGSGKIKTQWGTIISGNNISLTENRWYNLRFETYAYNNGGIQTDVIKVYVNGEFTCDILSADTGKTTSLTQAALGLRQFETDDAVAIDNVYVGTHQKTFTKGK